jgi:hypothetical protein
MVKLLFLVKLSWLAIITWKVKHRVCHLHLKKTSVAFFIYVVPYYKACIFPSVCFACTTCLFGLCLCVNPSWLHSKFTIVQNPAFNLVIVILLSN